VNSPSPYSVSASIGISEWPKITSSAVGNHQFRIGNRRFIRAFRPLRGPESCTMANGESSGLGEPLFVTDRPG
jgi:hypothetical protein